MIRQAERLRILEHSRLPAAKARIEWVQFFQKTKPGYTAPDCCAGQSPDMVTYDILGRAWSQATAGAKRLVSLRQPLASPNRSKASPDYVDAVRIQRHGEFGHEAKPEARVGVPKDRMRYRRYGVRGYRSKRKSIGQCDQMIALQN